jgi:hypothetical protein
VAEPEDQKWTLKNVDQLADTVVDQMGVTWCSGCDKKVAEAFQDRVAERIERLRSERD